MLVQNDFRKSKLYSQPLSLSFLELVFVSLDSLTKGRFFGLLYDYRVCDQRCGGYLNNTFKVLNISCGTYLCGVTTLCLNYLRDVIANHLCKTSYVLQNPCFNLVLRWLKVHSITQKLVVLHICQVNPQSGPPLRGSILVSILASKFRIDRELKENLFIQHSVQNKEGVLPRASVTSRLHP